MHHSVSFAQTGHFGNFRGGLFEAVDKPDLFLAILFKGQGIEQKDRDAAEFIKSQLKTVDFQKNENYKRVLGLAIRDYNIVDISVLVIVKGILYATVLGEMSVKIIRNGRFNNLLSGENEPLFLKGRVAADDIILAGSNDFFQNCSDRLLLEGFLQPDLKSAVEIINKKMVAVGYGGSGAVFTKIKNRESPINNLLFRLSRVIKKKSAEFHTSGESLVREKNKVSVSVGFILIILLVTSIVLGTLKKKYSQKIEREKEIANEVERKVDEAEAIFLLNPLRARELISSAQLAINGFDSKKSTSKTLDELKIKVKNAEKNILGEYEVSPEAFLNFSLLSDGFKGDTFAALGSKIYVFDRNGKKVVRIDVESKRSEVVAGPKDVRDSFLIIPEKEKVYFLSQKGIFESGGKEVVAGEFGTETLGLFYAGNLYLLNGQKSQIQRYSFTNDSFGSAQEWLSKDVKIDLSAPKTFVSDGYLWVLDKNSDVLKFSRGNKLKFAVSGITISAFSPEAIYTDEEQKYLYLLDKNNKRVVVTDKEGKYRAQYISDKLKTAKSVFVSEKIKKAFFLTDGEILSIALEHL